MWHVMEDDQIKYDDNTKVAVDNDQLLLVSCSVNSNFFDLDDVPQNSLSTLRRNYQYDEITPCRPSKTRKLIRIIKIITKINKVICDQ